MASLKEQDCGKNNTKAPEKTHGSTSVLSLMCTYQADLIKQ